MKLVYSPDYQVDIGPHVFPTEKYRLVRVELLDRGIARADRLIEPEAASWADLALVHTETYLRNVRLGELSAEEIVQQEIPWSASIVQGFRMMTGGTLLAARLAVHDRLAANIGGGFHHAFPNHGEGFCLFNDVAVAIRALQRAAVIARAAVVDCDVHHGNGTAMIFDTSSDVFTFSMHQQHNYPLFKPRSTLDIGLQDDTADHEYLAELDEALPTVMAHRPDLLFYLAGADPYKEDQLGGLALTKEGLRERDRMVLQAGHSAGVPIVVLLAGGYASHLEDTVAIHVATIEEATRVWETSNPGPPTPNP